MLFIYGHSSSLNHKTFADEWCHMAWKNLKKKPPIKKVLALWFIRWSFNCEKLLCGYPIYNIIFLFFSLLLSYSWNTHAHKKASHSKSLRHIFSSMPVNLLARSFSKLLQYQQERWCVCVWECKKKTFCWVFEKLSSHPHLHARTHSQKYFSRLIQGKTEPFSTFEKVLQFEMKSFFFVFSSS